MSKWRALCAKLASGCVVWLAFMFVGVVFAAFVVTLAFTGLLVMGGLNGWPR